MAAVTIAVSIMCTDGVSLLTLLAFCLAQSPFSWQQLSSLIPVDETQTEPSMHDVACSRIQVLESSQGGRTGSLMGALDNCTTPAGKRLLSQWLCRPLLHISDISARQDAVQDLIGPECADAVGAARKAFSGQPWGSAYHIPRLTGS